MALTQYGTVPPALLAAPVGVPALDPLFKAAVDDTFAHGQMWVRIGASEDAVLSEGGTSCTANSLTWNTANLALFDNAINYVKSKGMKVVLYLAVPIFFTRHQLTAATAAGATVLPLNTVDGLLAGSVVTIGFGGGAEDMRVQSISGLNVTMTSAAALPHALGDAVAMAASDYLNVVSMFCGTLAARWAGKIDLWEVWNENNNGDFRARNNNPNIVMGGGASVATINSTYTGEMATAMATARAAIRAHDGAPLTTSVGYGALDFGATEQAQWQQYFGAFGPSIDALAVDIYDNGSTNVNAKVQILNDLQTTLGKPLYVTEAGWPWDNAYGYGTTEAAQAAALTNLVALLKQAHPVAVTLYQYQDESVASGIVQHLGIVKNTGVQTAGYAAWWAATAQPPTMTAITPATGSILGGTIVAITGTNFVAGQTTVQFDALAAGNVVVVSPTQLRCTTPPHAAIGSSYVVLTTPGGAVANPALFTYVVPPGAVITSAGIVTRATNALVRMQDVGTGNLVAHIYAPAPLGTPDSQRTHLATADVESGTVVMTQANRFDGHTITFKEENRKATNALTVGATIDLEEPGLGIVARGIVTQPKQAVAQNGDGTITVQMENFTDEMNRANLGLRYVDQQEIGQIVRNMGNATTAGESRLLGRDATGKALTSLVAGTPIGWKADYLDDGTTEMSAAPVQWGDVNGGGILDLVANGNSIRRDLPAPTTAQYPSATGIPGHDDPNAALNLTWQVVVPTNGVAGFVQFAGLVGQIPPFGFQHSATTVGAVTTFTAQVVDGGVLVGAPIAVAPNTRFKVELYAGAQPARFYYYIQQPTDTTFQRVYLGTHTPSVPYFPGVAITNPGGEIANAVVTHLVPMSRIWWQVRDDGASNLGGLLNLAQDTGEFLRVTLDPLTGTPQRALEFGPLGENSRVTLVNAGAADLTRLKRNPRKRVVREVTEYDRVDNVVTVLTPLGGGAYPAQVDLERCYLMLYDAGYEHFYGTAAGGIASVFPEYDGNYTIHRTATQGGGYEYYIRYDPAFLPGGIGEIRGAPYVNQALGYPPTGATTAEQELVARTLYAAAVAQMRAGMRPRVTFTCTLFGVGRPPRAGSKVAVDYTHLAADRLGAHIPLRIAASPADDGLWRVLKVERQYGAGEPVDVATLSSSGRYGDAIQAATNQQRQQVAQQISTNAVSNVSMGTNGREEMDAANPITLNFHIDETCIRLTKARFHVEFTEYLQPVKTSRNPTGTPVVAVGGIDIFLPTPADLNALAANIGALPTHYHNTHLNASNNRPPDQISGILSATMNTQTGTALIFLTGGPSGELRTGDNISGPANGPVDLAPTSHPHVVAKRGDTIAHIPAGTILGDLPQHVHDIDPALTALTRPTQVSVWINGGDGAFVDRSPQVGNGTTTGPWTATFDFEASRFMDAPGRDVQVQFQSTNNANGGRGALRVSWTLVGLYVGTDAITSALA